jgi:hypothetical protein
MPLKQLQKIKFRMLYAISMRVMRHFCSKTRMDIACSISKYFTETRWANKKSLARCRARLFAAETIISVPAG